MLQSVGQQRVGHDLASEKQQQKSIKIQIIKWNRGKKRKLGAS